MLHYHTIPYLALPNHNAITRLDSFLSEKGVMRLVGGGQHRHLANQHGPQARQVQQSMIESYCCVPILRKMHYSNLNTLSLTMFRY